MWNWFEVNTFFLAFLFPSCRQDKWFTQIGQNWKQWHILCLVMKHFFSLFDALICFQNLAVVSIFVMVFGGGGGGGGL